MKTTPEIITTLQPNEIFVFGSNLGGIHGAGAARLALLRWGAIFGRGVGIAGQTYAIPTKDEKIDTLPIDTIRIYVDEFIEYAKNHPELIFLVTKIGCGLAGYNVGDISPLFQSAIGVDNIILPQEFYI